MRSIRVQWDTWCAAAGVLVLAGSLLQAGDQPQWGRHPSRNMVSDETGLPDRFDPATGLNVKWTARLGTATYSSPIIAEGRVLIGTNNGRPRDPRHIGDRGIMLCLRETDGEWLWQLVVPKRGPTMYWDWPRTGIVSPATVEGDRVYLVSNRGEVICLDLHGQANGNQGPFLTEAKHSVPLGAAPVPLTDHDADILWLVDMPKQAGVRQHDAAHGSVLVLGRFLYVCTSNGVNDNHIGVGAPEAPGLVVIDKQTGRLVAREREHIAVRTIHSTWSSPSAGQVNGRWLIFFGGGDGVCYAFEALSAPPPEGEVAALKKVWWFDCDPNAPKEDIFRYQDNRSEGPSNITGMPVFDRNRVYVTAGGDLWHGKPRSWLKCIDATGSGDLTHKGQIWSYAMPDHCMSTPAVYRDLVFIADCGGRIHCLDRETGKPHWVHDAEGDVWSSTFVADGKVYVGTRRGVFWVLAADRQKRVLSRIKLDGPIHSTAAAANGTLYIATMKTLYAAALPKP